MTVSVVPKVVRLPEKIHDPLLRRWGLAERHPSQFTCETLLWFRKKTCAVRHLRRDVIKENEGPLTNEKHERFWHSIGLNPAFRIAPEKDVGNQVRAPISLT